jgi:hypothetical protein
VEVWAYVRSGTPVNSARPVQARVLRRKLRVVGGKVWTAVEDWTAPGARPERSESEMSTLVAVVTLAAGLLILVTMFLTWVFRN